MGKGIGGHHRAYKGRNDEWITPKHVIDALGPFDLDPCAAVNQPWPCAKDCWDIHYNGLVSPWTGHCFCNPPYGPETGKWLEKCAEHRDCIALTFARVDTAWYHSEIFEKADAILFLKGRLTFCTVDGKKAPHNSGGPSCLVAYGQKNVQALRVCGLPGKLCVLKMDEEF